LRCSSGEFIRSRGRTARYRIRISRVIRRITLGWAEPAVRQNSLTAALQPDVYALPRVYKTLEVDPETGVVKSMKIREVA
jgi:hypothetical protein